MGPFPSLENRPDYITNALDSGFECECDVWFMNDTWWLGHDEPQFTTSLVFLSTPGLWIHAKNREALEKLSETRLNYFWHENDKYTLTSHGYIWAYPGSPISNKTICVMPENAELHGGSGYTLEEKNNALGMCSDYVLIEKLQ